MKYHQNYKQNITEQNYILRNNSISVSRRINTVHYGSESLWHLVPKLWRILSKESKKINFLNESKSKIKTWVPKNYTFGLSIGYAQHVAFISFLSTGGRLGKPTLISLALFVLKLQFFMSYSGIFSIYAFSFYCKL